MMATLNAAWRKGMIRRGGNAGWFGRIALMGAGAAMLAGGAPAAQAQVNNPGGNNNPSIDADLVRPSSGQQAPAPAPSGYAGAGYSGAGNAPAPYAGQAYAAPRAPAPAPTPMPSPHGQTYRQDDLIGAAEGVFGAGAKGAAQVIRDILKKQGEPNGYIVGREVGGAFAVGLRYGSGTLYHRVEGQRPVYWTGPSIGFDAGANAGNTFVLVYNLYNTEDLFKRFGAGEGQAYFVGGFNVSYLRRGDVVLIPVRLGVGMRLGINGGYMKFSRKQNWFPL